MFIHFASLRPPNNINNVFFCARIKEISEIISVLLASFMILRDLRRHLRNLAIPAFSDPPSASDNNLFPMSRDLGYDEAFNDL